MSKPFCGGRHTSGALPMRLAAIETGGFRQRLSEAEPFGQTIWEYALRGMLAGRPGRKKNIPGSASFVTKDARIHANAATCRWGAASGLEKILSRYVMTARWLRSPFFAAAMFGLLGTLLLIHANRSVERGRV